MGKCRSPERRERMADLQRNKWSFSVKRIRGGKKYVYIYIYI